MIFGVGIKPNVDFARETLACDKGILTNTKMQTEDPDIYAVGEAAQVKEFDFVAGHVKECTLQADAAIASILGVEERDFEPEVMIDMLKVDEYELIEVRSPEYSPNFEKVVKPKVKDGHCLLISPADIHIGKLCKSFVSGEEYNKQIAVQRTLEAVDGILQKSNGFNIDKLILCIGNDVMHIDTPSGGKTTKGTVQDVDGMFFEHFHIAKRLYINIIETLVSFYPDFNCSC